jgi:hypothetical protein
MVPDRKINDARWMILSAAVIILSLLIQFYVTNCGLLLTNDSREYLFAAKSFREHGVLTGTDGAPYVFWPPLFPMILSLFKDAATVMIWINLVLSGCVGVLISRLASRHLSDIRLRTGFLVSWMLGIHQLLISVFLWSELIFLVLLLAFVEQVIRSTTSQRSLVFAFLLGALLCLQRNAGLFVVPAAAIWLMFGDDNKLKSPWRALIVMLSIAGGLWWNVTNMFGTITTRVTDLDYFSFILDNVMIVTDGLSKSILPFTTFSIPIAMLIVVSPIVLIWPSRKLSGDFFLMALTCCFYLAGMAIVFRLDPGDADRYAAVILPFLLLFIFKILERGYTKSSKMIRTILLVAMIGWLAYPLMRTVRNALQWNEGNCSGQVERSS